MGKGERYLAEREAARDTPRPMTAEEEADEAVFVDFFLRCTQAMARARAQAEAQVHTDNPLAWLRYGPGRDRAGRPGWADSRQVSGPDAGPIQVSDGKTMAVSDVLAAYIGLTDEGE